MPYPPRLRAGVLIVATMATAAGLNLSVMNLGRASTATDEAAQPDVDATAEGASTVAPSTERVLASAAVSAIAEPVSVVRPVSVQARQDGERAASSGSMSSTSTNAPLQTASSSPPPSTSPSTSSSQPPAPAATGMPSTAPTATNETEPPQTTEYRTYEFEGVATIVVALHDGRSLEFWSATPEPGWAFKVEDRGPRNVKIKFRPVDGGDEAEFGLEFEDGRLDVKREY